MFSLTFLSQSELEALIETAVRGKEAAGEVIVGLMDSFEAARDDQSKQLHDKQSELDVSCNVSRYLCDEAVVVVVHRIADALI